MNEINISKDFEKDMVELGNKPPYFLMETVKHPGTCPKCGNADKFTVNVIRPKYTYNCKECECECEFNDDGIIEINIQKQLEEG